MKKVCVLVQLQQTVGINFTINVLIDLQTIVKSEFFFKLSSPYTTPYDFWPVTEIKKYLLIPSF